MIKILFLIHDLGQGGAEKVLVNLVNNMDQSKFDITVASIFGGGVNERFLSQDIHYYTVFPKEIPGNSKLMKILTPAQLHKLCVKEHYDIEVAYLEGPSARVISGCPDENTKTVCWIHRNFLSIDEIAAPFRNEREALKCYQAFDQIIGVSKMVCESFRQLLHRNIQIMVLYNTIESEYILQKSREKTELINNNSSIKLVSVGSLKEVKGYDRLLKVVKELVLEKYDIHLYLLGKGPLKYELEKYVFENNLTQKVTFLGYQINPYKYVAKCDLFVCSSYSEGFSTAVTESLIVGTPVCATDVSGMKELLGSNGEYGVITENTEEDILMGIKSLLNNAKLLEYYKKKSKERGMIFDTEHTVRETEKMFLCL